MCSFSMSQFFLKGLEVDDFFCLKLILINYLDVEKDKKEINI